MKIGFIGCGNMGSAMIGGILKNGVFEKNEIIVSNLTEEGSRRSREKLGVVTTLDNCEVVKNANIVILAVKPQFYEEVIGEIKSFLTPQHMIVGIAPGKTLAWLEEKCEQPLKVVRLMPNTPAQVGQVINKVDRSICCITSRYHLCTLAFVNVSSALKGSSRRATPLELK